MSADRYGNTKIGKIKAAYDDLRSAVRAGDNEAAQSALDRYEQWADFAFAPRADLTPPAADYVAGRLAGLQEAAALAVDFSWDLPMFSDDAVNEATDDAACAVQEQIAAAIQVLAARPASPDTRAVPLETLMRWQAVLLCSGVTIAEMIGRDVKSVVEGGQDRG